MYMYSWSTGHSQSQLIYMSNTRRKINFASLYLTTIPEDANSSSGAAVGSSICAMTTKPRSQLLQETIPITKKQNGSTTSSVLGHMGGLVDDTADPDENNDEEVMGSFRRTIPWKIFMALGVLVIVVGVGVFFIVKCVGNNNNSCRNTTSPTPSDYKQLPSSAPSIFPTFAPAFNDTASWQESLEQLFFSISGNDIYSPETPQGKATLWFEYNDTTITDYNTNDELVQRYALCVLFFALNSEPDGDIDECKWEGIQCRNHGTVFGIHRTGNALNGSIPSELRYLRNLTSLHLYNNSFTGQLPESLWSLTALTQLNFFNNSFTGQLPESLWLLTALTQLDLADNAFNGTISKSIMKLSNLQSLFLNGNNLIGSLPTEIGDYLNSLINFSVESNNLTGQIPENIWLLKSLVEMHFSQNSFRGTLSPFIWSRPNLTYLAASENALTGSIPAIPDNTTVSPLIKFHIYSNHLTGKLPDALSLLSDSLREYCLDNFFAVMYWHCTRTHLDCFGVLHPSCRRNRFFSK